MQQLIDILNSYELLFYQVKSKQIGITYNLAASYLLQMKYNSMT